MQMYQANGLLAVEQAKGHLLYVVGHFVRRDGALPRDLHGTCVETQQLIPNVMCVFAAPLERTARSDAALVHPTGLFLKPGNKSVVFPQSLAWQHGNNVGGDRVIKEKQMRTKGWNTPEEARRTHAKLTPAVSWSGTAFRVFYDF